MNWHLLALAALFAFGVVLRQSGRATPRHAALVLVLVINVGIPAVMLGTVSRQSLQRAYLVLPMFASLMVITGLGLGWVTGRALQLPRASHGAFMAAVAAMNTSFEYPFVLAAWGTVAFAQLAIFDVGSALTHLTVLYMAAAAMSGHRTGFGVVMRRALRFPPLWALTAALLINLLRVPLPASLLDGLQHIGQWVLVGMLLGMGILLEPRQLWSRPVLTAVGLRLSLGLVGGMLAVTLLDIHGLQRGIMLVGAAAPVGFTSVAIAHREQLDVALATAAASLSAMLGVVLLPVALLILR